ncbi:MAG: glycosyltransferase family 2 protein [Acidobacteriota bacterium]|nr:glycosyltransferase family 2 protein [Acidobacteriota bacterium]MDQ5871023.1 glycosyltransferase family 2 protein [Acidobacteriota bacterium]
MAVESQPRLGVGFLAYNEEESIPKTVSEAVASLSAIEGLDWRVLIVNDGSRDRTGEIAEALAAKDPRVLVVHHDGNKGYAVATETALRNTPGEVVMVVDGDGQHTMADAPRFLEAIDSGADVVFGWKKKRHDPWPRLILSKGLNTLSGWFLGSPLHDINGGCRAFRRGVAQRIEIRHRINFVGDEIFARCRIAGWRVAEVVVRHFPREAGQSIHRPWKMVGTIGRVLRYLAELRSEIRQSDALKRVVRKA